MIFGLLFVIILTLLYNLYLIYRIKKQEAFLDILKIYLFYELLHVSYTILMKSIFAELKYLDFGAPFAFAYGPLFYFAVHTSINRVQKIDHKKLFIHISPSFIFWPLFLLLILFKDHVNRYLWTYYTTLAVAQGASMLGYTLWAILSSKTRLLLAQMNSRNSLLNIASSFLGIMSVFFVVIAVSRVFPKKTAPPGLGMYLIYGSIFVIVISICRYLFKRTRSEKISGIVLEEVKETKTPIKTIGYDKSSVPSDQLMSYHTKLEKLMSEDKIFLNSNLTLENVAFLLRITRHHASQLFNQYLNQNFNAYINRYRIEWACKLLLSEPQMTVDEIGIASGVTSKATFHRIFKQLKGCSPAEFRKKSGNHI